MSFSDVAIAMLKTDYAQIQQVRAKLTDEVQLGVKKLFKGASVVESAQHRDYVIIHWQWVKWNDRYPEIQFLQNFLEKIGKYDFIRIGVEYDDVECVFNSGDYVIGIEHRITYTAEESEVSEMDYNAIWKSMVNSLKKNPRDIITVPLTKQGVWFYAYAEDNYIFVENSRTHSDSCKIKGRRKIEEKELPDMLSIYQRRCMGEHVSQEAEDATYNKVYWYGILAEFELDKI